MRVVNIKENSFDVYVGRPSVYGNPFRIGEGWSRDDVMRKYAEHVLTLPDEALRFLEGKTLGCHCKPKACHGDLIISEMIRRGMVAPGIRVLVCGGRDFTARQMIFDALDQLSASHVITGVIHGRARGVDAMAGQWAESRGMPCVSMPADWNRYGKRAGSVRNQAMLDTYHPEYVVAFPGGAGTADMVSRSRAAGLPVWTPYGINNLT